MARLADTGNGASITIVPKTEEEQTEDIGDPTWVAGWTGRRISRIAVGAETLELINVSSIEDEVYNRFIKADLRDPPTVTIDFFEDTEDERPVIGTEIETFTITAPLRPGEATAAKIAGSAIVVGFTAPTYANNEPQAGQLVVRFDGETGPAYTKSTLTP